MTPFKRKDKLTICVVDTETTMMNEYSHQVFDFAYVIGNVLDSNCEPLERSFLIDEVLDELGVGVCELLRPLPLPAEVCEPLRFGTSSLTVTNSATGAAFAGCEAGGVVSTVYCTAPITALDWVRSGMSGVSSSMATSKSSCVAITRQSNFRIAANAASPPLPPILLLICIDFVSFKYCVR